MALLHTSDLRSGYGDIEVLHGVSISVEEGQFVAIIGGNGAGKTTFLRTLSGLVRVTGGGAEFDEHDLTQVPAHRIPSLGIAHVPEGRQIFPELSVEENLLIGAYVNRHPDVRQRQLEMIFEFFPWMRRRAKQSGGTLSGGEQQMLAIGRALMLAPRMMLLDEPSQGLAPKIVGELYEKLGEIHSTGTTLLIVEQNVVAAFQVASRAYVLEQGRIALEGPSDELQRNDEVRRAYLGV